MLHKRRQGDFDLKWEQNSKTDDTLRFVNIGVGLQRLTHVIRQNFKLIIVSAIALGVYAKETPPSMSVLSPK